MRDKESILGKVFKYRWRGARQNTAPILYTDFDASNLRMFEVMPPAALERWDDLSAWSITERGMSGDEFREVAEFAEGKRMPPLGSVCFSVEGGPVHVVGYIKRPFRDEWVLSTDLDEVNERAAARVA
jgi:hypothetical protein